MNVILFLFEPINMKLKKCWEQFFVYIFILSKKNSFFPKNGKKNVHFWVKNVIFEKIQHLAIILPPKFCEEW